MEKGSRLSLHPAPPSRQVFQEHSMWVCAHTLVLGENGGQEAPSALNVQLPHPLFSVADPKARSNLISSLFPH